MNPIGDTSIKDSGTSKHESVVQLILIVLPRALIISPIAGCSIGALVVSWVYDFQSDPNLGSFYRQEGMFFGGFTGLLFGLIIAWPTRHIRLSLLAVFLASGTVIGSMPGCIIGGESAMPVAWFGGMVGFWVGFTLLMLTASGVLEESESGE